MSKVVNNVVKCSNCGSYIQYEDNDVYTRECGYGVGTYYGETYTGKKYLTKEYINNMTPATAKRVYEAAQKSQVYTRATMEKLYYRSLGIPLF